MDLNTFTSIMKRGRDVLTRCHVDFADARVDSIRAISCKINNPAKISYSDASRYGLGIRAINGSEYGFVAQEGLFDWTDMVQRASLLLEEIRINSERTLIFAPCDIAHRVETDPIISSPLSTPHLMELYHILRESMPAAHVRLTYKFKGGFRGVTNSEGACVIQSLSYQSLGFTALIPSKDERLIPLPIWTASTDQSDLVDLMKNKLTSACSLASQLISAKSFEATQCPVVLGPSLTAFLIHEAFGHLCEADRIPPSGISKWQSGLLVGPPNLQVCDRADIPGAPGTSYCDDEAVPCKTSILIDRGRWTGLLHSRKTAGFFNHVPTGNAIATSFRFMPICRMRITQTSAGELNPSDLFTGIRDGLFLDTPYGGHLRGPIIRIVAIDARRIVNGKLDEPLAGAVLFAQPLTILKSIDAIANNEMLLNGLGECSREDQHELPVTSIAPSIRLKQAQVFPF